METVTVTVGATQFVILQDELADFISFMSGVKIKEGYGASAEVCDVKFSLDYTKVDQTDKTDREKALEEERDQRSRWWLEEQAKVRKLEAALTELKATIGNSTDD